MTYISWSSDFALYLEDCLMHECILFGIMSRYDTKFYLKIPIFYGPVILHYIEDYLMYEHHTLGLRVSMT